MINGFKVITRREIAYTDFKGKTTTYLENSKKPSIYDNYDALRELHDAGGLSDEDFDKAGREFDKKRAEAIAEYNACQGPWPYLWKNIDPVVCGILQQNGIASIDYYDLKYLYEADSVYEVRVKGSGTNDEEEIQSIIDTIRKVYTNMLKSSKKLAVTLSCSSTPSAYLEKIADCLNDKVVVWKMRALPVGEEMELSIVFTN